MSILPGTLLPILYKLIPPRTLVVMVASSLIAVMLTVALVHEIALRHDKLAKGVIGRVGVWDRKTAGLEGRKKYRYIFIFLIFLAWNLVIKRGKIFHKRPKKTEWQPTSSMVYKFLHWSMKVSDTVDIGG